MNTTNTLVGIRAAVAGQQRKRAEAAKAIERAKRDEKRRQSAHDRDPRVRLCRQERRRRDQRIARQIDESRVVFLAVLAEESAARQRGRPKKSVAGTH